MPKAKVLNNGPGTMTGRVLSRLDEIEAWFRSGYKTKEVRELLAKDGITMHKNMFTALLSRYGKSERAIRRAMAADMGVPPRPELEQPSRPASGPLPPAQPPQPVAANKPPKTAGKPEAGKTGESGSRSRVAEELKKKDASRVVFRPNPNPKDEDVY